MNGTDPEPRPSDADAPTEPDAGWPVADPVTVRDVGDLPTAAWDAPTDADPDSPAPPAAATTDFDPSRLLDSTTDGPTVDWSGTTGLAVARPAADPAPAAQGGRYDEADDPQLGGIGRVWRVRDTLLNRRVALKDLRRDRLGDPRLVRRFLREAQVTAQLQHPNIVPVHDLSRGPDGRYFYTMKFVEGRTLRQAIGDYHPARKRGEARPLEFRELILAVVSVARALAYAHSRGVLHRDLKPQNVVLGAFGEVFLLDWGLARLRKPESDPTDDALGGPGPGGAPATVEAEPEQTDAAAVLGTWAYMPPEQAEGRNDLVDRRTDVFGLGAILYEVLTDSAPIAGARGPSEHARLLDAGLKPPRSINPEVPKPLEAIALKAVARGREDRYPTADALADDLLRWLADEPVSALREPWVARVGRWGRRHRGLLVSAGGVLVLTCAVLGAAVYLVDQERQAARKAESLTRQFAGQASDALNRTNAAYVTTLGALTDLNQLAARDLAHVPGMTEFRRKILEVARPRLEEMVAAGNNPAARSKLTETLRELALIARFTRRPDEAEALYREAIEVRRTQQVPNDFQIAQLLYDLAVLRLTQGLLPEAEESGRESDAILGALLRVRPDLDYAARLRAINRGNLGMILQRRGRPEDAIGSYELANAYWADEDARGRAVEGPSNGYRWVYLPGLGQALRDAGRLEESARMLADADRLVRAAITAFPSNNDLRMIAVEVAIERARTLLALDPGRAAEALPWLDEALDSAAGLARDFPEVVGYEDDRVRALSVRAEALEALGRAEPAEADRRSAVGMARALLGRNPEDPNLNLHAAEALLGHAAPAVARQDPDAAALLDEAEAGLRRARERFDRDPDVLRGLERLERLRAGLGPREVNP
jgi:tetratricopeptide (TPR) repeat protein/tRNA A-37 threonylcarbamoyl transferase component Bud32